MSVHGRTGSALDVLRVRVVTELLVEELEMLTTGP